MESRIYKGKKHDKYEESHGFFLKKVTSAEEQHKMELYVLRLNKILYFII